MRLCRFAALLACIFSAPTDTTWQGACYLQMVLSICDVNGVIGLENDWAARKGARIKNQSLNPSTNKDAVCWHFEKKGHLSTECWSNPPRTSLVGRGENTKSSAGQGAGFLEQGDQHRLRNLADHCTWMQKVGWDRTYDLGAAISHFHWKRRWVCNRKRTVQTTKLFQENSSLTVVATEYGYGVTFRGREADAHKALISAIKVRSEGHVAVVDSQGGCIIPCSSALARKNGTYIGYTKIKKLVQTQKNQQLCSMHARHLRCFLLFGQRDCMHSCFSVLMEIFLCRTRST